MIRSLSVPLVLAAGFLLTAVSARPAAATDKPPSDEDVRFFESRIRPLLVEKCLKCHGPAKQKGDLRLDSSDAIKRGGASGEPLVVAGKPDQSYLVRAVQHAADVPKMPPDEKLTAAQIADLTKWVSRGAPFPQSAAAKPDSARTADHWAFRPISNPPVPTVKDAKWPKTAVDRFVLAKLESKGIRPVSQAGKRTLIRRATFDLIGLPPTPEEIEDFLKDQSPDAFAKVVDRLLASPHYGERWGRHWLDVARYADSNGLDENVAHGNAWRYRDYVISAFNSDKPYDQFLLEQIAGDLLPADSPAARAEHLVATGFLALGPKVLAEPDEKKMELDIVDEQIDTLGRSVMGLTLGCARCHDHKFDPINLGDYYGLAGIFISTKTMESFKKVARWHENSLASPEEVKKQAAHEANIAKVRGRIKTLTGQPDGGKKEEIKRLQAELAALEKAAPDLPSAMGVTEGSVTDAPLLRRGDHLRPGALTARRFPAVLAGKNQTAIPKTRSGRLDLARWLVRPENPLTARVMVNRVWRWHFGHGLVGSVDNFGLLGEKPSHPELLDWLAHDFAQSGWSLKKLHRRIMLSATYQASSTIDPKAAAIDPENQLLWRANVQRIEAEEIRDSLLAVGGLLDRTAGGPAFSKLKNRAYVFDHTSKDNTNYDATRRSVYLPVIRNNLYDVFGLFDSTDATVPSGDRATTTVATQSLFFLNSPLVARAADALATRVLTSAETDDPARIRLLYAFAYGRTPTAKEVGRITAAVSAFDAKFAAKEGDREKRRQKAWSLVCQAVLAANEFVYVN